MGIDSATPHPEHGASGEARLDSWKSISNYLGKAVRTVQRWERTEDLPVHRHEHDSKASVFAYKSELDAWWAAHSDPAAEGHTPEAWYMVHRRAITLAALLAITAITVWLLRPAPILPFEERDWILVADFDNRTGEEVFDGTIEHALERELANSRYSNVVPHERIIDSLRLMKLPGDTRLDPALAREVALRDGDVRALITGRIDKLDGTYLLSLDLVNPADGVKVAAFSGEADGHSQVIATIRELSNQLRRSLGEKLAVIKSSEQKLEKVTTPSLRALQLYSRAMRLGDLYKWSEAAEFFHRAVQEDPEFASAHILLAHALANLGRDDAAAPHFVKAFELADRTVDHERYFILGSYYQRYEQDYEQAWIAYKALLEINPDHYWGNNNLGLLYYRDMRQPHLALPYMVARARLRPNDFWASYITVRDLLTWGIDSNQIDQLIDRMRQLAVPGSDELAALRITEVRRLWIGGEPEAALSELEQMVEEIESLPEAARDVWLWRAARAYFAIGRLRLAGDLMQSMFRPSQQYRYTQALLALARNRPGIVQAQIEFLPPSFLSVVLLVKINHLEAAEEMFASLISSEADGGTKISAGMRESESMRKIAEGTLAYARGRIDEAILLLEQGVREVNSSYSHHHLAAEALAQAWETKGDLSRAVEAIRISSHNEFQKTLIVPAFFSMNNKLKLSEVHRKIGNLREADRLEDELRDQLAYAEPDHPILVRISRSRGTDTIAASNAP